jgi:hypothetical protein
LGLRLYKTVLEGRVQKLDPPHLDPHLDPLLDPFLDPLQDLRIKKKFKIVIKIDI